MLEVVGPSLVLRPPSVADAPALLRIGADPEVTRWFSWGPYRDEAEPRAWIARTEAERAAGQRLALAVHRGSELTGIIELAEYSPRDRRAMVGTWLGRAWWGTGVNAEAKALVLHLAFAELELRRVGAYTNVTNVRSQRALERLGFVREGELRRWHRHGDGFLDVFVYGLLREEWRDELPVAVRGELPAAFREPERAATPAAPPS